MSVASTTTTIFRSAETKAVETAQPLAKAFGCDVQVREGMHENDRSSTGYLQLDAFEAVADQFFAEADARARGWLLKATY